MKNKFLLLGATALLSTGLAMDVMAEDEPSTTTLNVNVEFLAPDIVVPVQHIDFGKILLDTEQVGQQFDIIMDPATGKINDYEAVKLFGEQKNGQVALEYLTTSSKKTIQLEDRITLHDLEGHLIEFYPSSTEIYSTLRAQYKIKTYGIGGRLFAPYSDYGYQPGKYSGELTVTVIADE